MIIEIIMMIHSSFWAVARIFSQYMELLARLGPSGMEKLKVSLQCVSNYSTHPPSYLLQHTSPSPKSCT